MPPSVAIMVIMIVAIVAASRVMRERYRAHGRDRVGHAPGPDQLRTDQEIRQLKERIQVLERVITDNHSSVDLDRRIESLRDR